MARPKGLPKTGGRVKGVLNQKRQELLEMAAANGKNPFQVMFDLLDNEDLDLRFQAAKELAQYILPKLKSVEFTGKDGAPIGLVAVTHEENLALAQARKTAARE